MTNSPNPNEKSAESRLVPFTVAGIICFGLALLLGMGSWYLFGTSHRVAPEKDVAAVQISNQNAPRNSTGENSNAVNSLSNSAVPVAASPAEVKKAPAGEISIGGGEVTLGGGDTKLPLRRIPVAPFAIGETEVTNAQYAEFVEESKHKAPAEWKDNKFPNGTASEPVVGVTWADANDYCKWLSEKLGATVRLPSEAEWEMAARGATNSVYPWGNEWIDDAADSLETKGKVRPVKSFPKGRTASGIYDMVGNVYEWTGDLSLDETGNPALFEKMNQRVIKGGSVEDTRKLLTIKLRYNRPEEKPSKLIGFRYVVVRK